MSEPDFVGLWLCLRAIANNGANEVRARGFTCADVPPGPGFVAEVLELGGGLSLEVVVRSRPTGLPLVRDAAALAPAPPASPADSLLHDVEQAAIDHAPLPSQRPVTLKELARRADYSIKSNHFRKAVDKLVECGLLERIRGRFRCTKAGAGAKRGAGAGTE